MDHPARTAIQHHRPTTALYLVNLLRKHDQHPHDIALADAHYSGEDLPDLLHQIGWTCLWERLHHGTTLRESLWASPRAGEQVHLLGGDVYARPATTLALLNPDDETHHHSWATNLRHFIRSVPLHERIAVLDMAASHLDVDAPEPTVDPSGSLRCPHPECSSPDLVHLDLSLRHNPLHRMPDGTVSATLTDTEHDDVAAWACRTCRTVLTPLPEVELLWH